MIRETYNWFANTNEGENLSAVFCFSKRSAGALSNALTCINGNAAQTGAALLNLCDVHHK